MEKTILKATNKERKKAIERFTELYMKHRGELFLDENFEKAMELVAKLGLSGLWRGYELAVMAVYDALTK